MGGPEIRRYELADHGGKLNLSANKLAKKEYDALRYQQRRAIYNSQSKAWRISHPHESVASTRKWKAKMILEIGREAMNKHFSESAKIRNAKPINRLKILLVAAKIRAKKKTLPFSICVEDFLPLPTHCPVLGIKLNYAGQVKRGFVNDSPSLDRAIPSLGYISGNVKIISWRANRIKSDATLEELQKITAYAAQQ